MLYLYLSIIQKINELRSREEGQDLAEYALLIGLIALVVFLAVILVGNNLSTFFNNIGTQISSWMTP